MDNCKDVLDKDFDVDFPLAESRASLPLVDLYQWVALHDQKQLNVDNVRVASDWLFVVVAAAVVVVVAGEDSLVEASLEIFEKLLEEYSGGIRLKVYGDWLNGYKLI